MNITVNPNSGYYDLGSSVSSAAEVGKIQESPQQVQVSSDLLSNIKAGDTFSGQVVGMNKDGMVQILLGNQSTISAKLSQNISLALGQTISFQVNSANNSKIFLTPLYANLDGNSAIAKALDAAGLPVTRENAGMVSAMMERGLPVDAKSLQEMAYLSSQHPLADPKSIVQMNQLGIPLTEENIQAFEAYKENQHQIADSVFGLSEGFAELAGKSPALNNEITQLFFGSQSGEMSAAVSQAMNGDSAALLEALGLPPETLEEAAAAAELLQGEGAISEEEGQVQGQGAEQNGAGTAAGKDSVKITISDGQPQNPAIGESGSSVRDITGHVTESVHDLLGQDGAKDLAVSLKNAGLPAEIAAKVADGTLDNKQIFELTRAVTSEALTGELGEEARAAAKELIQREPYQLLLKNQITDQFLLKPEDISDKEKVQEYYNKIANESKAAMNLLSRLGQDNTPLAQGMKELSSNVDFMNQLNHIMTYVQLPLKMNNNAAHGDLYVYTNKKKLASKDGNVSALLHLDMEHLGTMDIHVAMTDYQKVQTHFLLQSEEFLDFIAQHLNELDAALAKRGYQMKSDVSLNREKTDVPEIMFNKGTDKRLIQTTSFDLRA
ncbi:MAG: flagellar hook-length control protein FliK [Lachnospiraceae bacterium]|nr:flagellar hook-length control protein FliK [Lachnospiraceae bacterium]